MSEFHEALRSHLLDQPDIKRVLHSRIFHSSVAPRDKTKGPLWPRVQYEVTQDGAETWCGGETGSGRATLTYTIDTTTARQAREIKELIRQRLNGLNNVTIDGVRIQHVLMQSAYEVEYEPEAGHEIPPYAMAVDFDVMHVLDIADPQPEVDPGDDDGSGGPVDPPPDSGIAYWGWTATDEMTAQYGDSGTFDVGLTGALSGVTPAQYWYGDIYFVWYQYRAAADAGQDDGTVTDYVNGTPQGVSIFNGTVDRIKAANASARVFFYTTLLRAGTTDTLRQTGAWPQTRPILTSDYDSAWLSDPGDAYTGEKQIDYTASACRTVQGAEWARMVNRMKEAHTGVDGVFSDNWAHPQVAPTVDWTSLCNLGTAGINYLVNTFEKAVPLVTNITLNWKGNMLADLDTLANAGIAGIHNEGICHEHYMIEAEFPNVYANMRHWIAKPWTGGGRRALFSNCRNGGDSDYGLNRRVQVDSVTVGATTLDITLASPHRLADTTAWRVSFTGFHATLNGGGPWNVTPHATDPNRLTLNYGSTPPASGYTTGVDTALMIFSNSGRDVDAGWLHTIRQRGDTVRATHIYGSADGRGYCTPLWRTWAQTYGYATGEPIVLSTHSVDLADYFSSGVVTCVKEIKTPFTELGSWYLHIDFSLAERRVWWEEETE